MMFYRNGTRFKLHPLTSSEIITTCNGEQINLNQQVQGSKGMNWIIKKVVMNNSKHNKSDKV